MEDLYIIYTELNLLVDWHFERTDLKCKSPQNEYWLDDTEYCPFCQALDEMMSCKDIIYKKLCEHFGIKCEDDEYYLV